MVRLTSPESTGFFTLLLATSQLVSTLGRMGMNYSYSVLLPRHGAVTEERRSLLSTYLITSFISSLLIAFIALWRLSANGGIPGSPAIRGLMLSITITYLATDCLAEILWGVHLAEGRFQQLFYRDIWIALAKGSIPLIGAICASVLGLSIGLTIVSAMSCSLAIRAFKTSAAELPSKASDKAATLFREFSPRVASLLFKKGLPFYSVPLINNIILWPFLLHYVKHEGLASLDGLRIAQICAQAIGALSAAIMPVLLIENLTDKSKDNNKHLKAFEACWLLSMLLFTVFLITSSTFMPWMFGPSSTNAAPIARILVAGAALQGLSQIPLQRALETQLLIKISAAQVISLVASGLLAIYLFTPEQSLMAYASVNLLSPLLTIIVLPFLLGRLTPKRTPLLAQIFISIVLIGSCYITTSSSLTGAIAIAALIYLLLANKGLLSRLAAHVSLKH
jgi:O-antigen/teichoic acid export membrane protein